MSSAVLLFVLSAALSGGAAQSVREDPGEVALRYLEHLYGSDLEALEQMTSENLLFHDETSSVFPNGPWRFEGRAQILDFFRRSSQGVESHSFEVLRRFTSGEQTVLEVTYRTRGDGAALGYPGLTLELEVPAVTVIRVRHGLVVEHEDFVDYPTMMKQVKEQTEAKP